MKVYNTLTRRLDDLNSDGAASTRIYLCGVTVYDNSHVGHARTIVVFDILRRYLLSKNCPVEFIQNFTDVDDKIINRATQEGVTVEEVASRVHTELLQGFQFPKRIGGRSISQSYRAHTRNDTAYQCTDEKRLCVSFT